jgi:predicted ATPase
LRSGATPLVGRDEEIALLLRRWEQAKAGNGRVVLVSAEPGVGKSRLAEALAERIADEPHTRLRYFCSPHHQDSALYPVIAQMERAAGFAHADGPTARLGKLQALRATTSLPMGDVGLIADLHSLPSSDLAPPLDLTPQRKKDKTFETLLRRIEGLSRQQPVLMMFDDIHWIDPSSREMLDRTIERVADWPVLLLAMFRPVSASLDRAAACDACHSDLRSQIAVSFIAFRFRGCHVGSSKEKNHGIRGTGPPAACRAARDRANGCPRG